MKTHRSKQSRRQMAARLFFCLILVGVLTGGLTSPGQACGVITHPEIVDLAVEQLAQDPQYRDLHQFLVDYSGVVHYGSVWPDWPFAKKVMSGFLIDWATMEGEAAHQARFRDGFTLRQLEQFRNPTRTPDEKKTIAFLLGVISHQEADNVWHAYYGIQPLSERVTGIGHTDFELTADLLIYERTAVTWDWYLPAAEITQTYAGLKLPTTGAGGYGATPNTITDQQTWYNAVTALDYVPFSHNKLMFFPGSNDAEKLKWLTNHSLGGLANGASKTVQAWKQTWDWLKTYTPHTAVSLTPAPPAGEDVSSYWYSQPVTVALRGTDRVNGVIDVGIIMTPTVKTVHYSLLRENLSGATTGTYTFSVSTEGSHPISFYTVDAHGNREAVQTLMINIKLPRPGGPEEAMAETDPLELLRCTLPFAGRAGLNRCLELLGLR